ncbi:hypothetical protein [Neptunitalea lumnitzerae]|uniref:Uncharacterized protein n=1 Tax=Neptunitalea lumnitzerae TaxID=2965509 RepID=A0ABQ5ME90_9FLAO|nr:hypothetical protein [Neptunitalea sp. Y10]GLB47700.1 hypothetical protein Y10_00680 [Neptunitalea sp. Y10]
MNTEIILLDSSGFNKSTNQWNVPMLKLNGVKVIGLNVNGKDVSSRDYNILGNVITFNKHIIDSSRDVAHLLVEIKPSSKLISFWLPVILAIIGFFGTISQPVLNKIGVLYKNNDAYFLLDNVELSYDTGNNIQSSKLSISPVLGMFPYDNVIDKEDAQNWRVYVALNEEQNFTDSNKQCYSYFSGPFDIRANRNTRSIHVKTDPSFTDMILSNPKKRIHVIYLKIKKGIKFSKEICLENYVEGEDYVIFEESVFKINETLSFR